MFNPLKSYSHPALKESCRGTGCLQLSGNTWDKGTKKKAKRQRKRRKFFDFHLGILLGRLCFTRACSVRDTHQQP